MQINLKLYDKCKYKKDSKVIKEVIFSNIKSLRIVRIPESFMSKVTDAEGVDDYNEYLMITYKDNKISMLRNSYVDVFRMENGQRAERLICWRDSER